MTNWVIRAKKNNLARIRLYCFPSAGRGASSFGSWTQIVRPELDICSIQLPGRENRYRESSLARIDDVLSGLLPHIEGSLELPFAFFGHSLGALIGFELIRLLRKRGSGLPLHFFVSARRAPNLAEPNPPISHLPDAEFLENVQQRFGGIPEAILKSPDMLQIMTPVLRSDFEMIEKYQYRNEDPLDCPITALGGLGDSSLSQWELEAWKNQTSGRFQVNMFPGDHFYLQNSRAELLQVIWNELKNALDGLSRGVNR